MPKRVPLSHDDIEWLRENHESMSFTAMAQRLGCCTDSLKRILVRQGLRDFDGAKYQLNRNATQSYWTRPCISCGDPERRPRNWYFCRDCRRKNDIGTDDE